MRIFCSEHNYKLLDDKFTANSNVPSFVNVDTRIRKYYKYKTDIDYAVRDKLTAIYHISSPKCN